MVIHPPGMGIFRCRRINLSERKWASTDVIGVNSGQGTDCATNKLFQCFVTELIGFTKWGEVVRRHCRDNGICWLCCSPDGRQCRPLIVLSQLLVAAAELQPGDKCQKTQSSGQTRLQPLQLTWLPESGRQVGEARWGFLAIWVIHNWDKEWNIFQRDLKREENKYESGYIKHHSHSSHVVERRGHEIKWSFQYSTTWLGLKSDPKHSFPTHQAGVRQKYRRRRRWALSFRPQAVSASGHSKRPVGEDIPVRSLCWVGRASWQVPGLVQSWAVCCVCRGTAGRGAGQVVRLWWGGPQQVWLYPSHTPRLPP